MWLALVFTFALSAVSQTGGLQHNSNLRKSASTSSAVIETLPAGTQVSLISSRRRSGYYHVRTEDGAVGWVLAKNVSISSSNRTAAAQPTSGSLLNQLHAARVAAVPQPLVIGGQEVCAATGNSSDPKMIKLNSQKNRTDIPNATAYIPVDWNVLKGLPSNSPDDLQGAPVMVIGYLSHRINVENKAPGESTNCNLNTNKQVRISGWLMYDFQHVPDIGTQRATVWEVHPITRIEVAGDGNGGWQDIEQKPN
jgi:uncharacterized protein YgiM (DUF1202 family)